MIRRNGKSEGRSNIECNAHYCKYNTIKFIVFEIILKSLIMLYFYGVLKFNNKAFSWSKNKGGYKQGYGSGEKKRESMFQCIGKSIKLGIDRVEGSVYMNKNKKEREKK